MRRIASINSFHLIFIQEEAALYVPLEYLTRYGEVLARYAHLFLLSYGVVAKMGAVGQTTINKGADKIVLSNV